MSVIKWWEWKLLFVDEQGNIQHIKFFKSLTTLTWFLLICSLCAGIYFYVLCENYKKENKNLQNQLVESGKQILELNEENKTFMERMSPKKKNNISDLEKSDNINNAESDSKDMDKQVEQSKTTDDSDVKKSLVSFKNIETDNRVFIEEFGISNEPETNNFKLGFRLNNIKPDLGTISGNIFVILKTEESKPDKWLIMPNKTKLVLEKPLDIKSGLYFSIKNFNNIMFDIPESKILNQIKVATILIYENTGKLLMEKSLDVSLR